MIVTRRGLIVFGAAGLAASPAVGQPPKRLPVVAFIGFATSQADNQTVEAFRQGLRELGHREGATVIVEAHSNEGDVARGLALIQALAARQVDIFLSPGPAVTRLIARHTRVPVVAIALPPESAGSDLFASLARPGGLVTGFSTYGEHLSAKRIELLREALPGVTTVGIMHNATDPSSGLWGDQTAEDARRQGLSVHRLALASTEAREVERQLDELRRSGGKAVIVLRDFLTASRVAEIGRIATSKGIAAFGESNDFPRAGALISYGPDVLDLFRRAAGYVDRILKGERPGDLPIQLPTKFELAVNLETAKALGLTIPPSILIRADEVIE
ncbi:MAG: ABC transporter substrate-binding protein [Hyphomicrobiaceae bacterium]